MEKASTAASNNPWGRSVGAVLEAQQRPIAFADSKAVGLPYAGVPDFDLTCTDPSTHRLKATGELKVPWESDHDFTFGMRSEDTPHPGVIGYRFSWEGCARLIKSSSFEARLAHRWSIRVLDLSHKDGTCVTTSRKRVDHDVQTDYE
jgi:hypothetical protein